jgi:hypothetical protein
MGIFTDAKTLAMPRGELVVAPVLGELMRCQEGELVVGLVLEKLRRRA